MPSFQLSFQTNYRFAENICKPHIWYICLSRMGFPCSLVGKESACSAGDPGLMPGLGRSPGEGNGNPLQYPCLEKLTDRGAWWAAVQGSQRVGHNQAINPNSYLEYIRGFIGSSADKKKSTCSAGDPSSIPGSGRSLEKEMATHSSVLAWRIPRTEEHGGLQSMGSQRGGQNWATYFQNI